MARKKSNEDQSELAFPVPESVTETSPVLPAPVEWDLCLDLVTESLCVKLTDEEVLSRGKDLAYEMEEFDEAENRKKAAAEEMKASQVTIDALKRAVLYRQEVRDVVCVQRPDWTTHRVGIYRDDTGDPVRWREMTLGERTPLLPLAKKEE